MSETEEIQLNLKWDNFSSHLALSFDSCYESQQFVDVSLVCKDGEVIKGHKMILANTSKFFRRLLTENDHPHPMIVLHTIDADDLRSLMTFMYCGEVQVFQNDLKKLLEIADTLEITGLQQIQELDNPKIRLGVKNFATLNPDFDQQNPDPLHKNDADPETDANRLNKPASNLLKYVSSLGQKNLDNSVQSFESSSKKLQEMARKFENCPNSGGWSFLHQTQNTNETKIREISTECRPKTFQILTPDGEPESSEYKSSSRKLQEMAKLLENINRNPALSEVSKGTSEGQKRSSDSDRVAESPAKKPNLNQSARNTCEAEHEQNTGAGRQICDERIVHNCNVFIKDELEVDTDCSTTPDVDLDNLPTDHLNATSNGEHSGTSMLAAELLKAVANKRKDNWMIYIDKKLADLENKISSEIRSTRKSILYDLENKISEVKNAIILSTGGEARVENVSSARERLNVSLPITSLEDYLTFEDQISSTEEKKQSLKSLFVILIAGSTSWKDDVGKLMNAVISKAVQIHFSGCGRKVKGEGKRNFSGTNVFECMRDTKSLHVAINKLTFEVRRQSNEIQELRNCLKRRGFLNTSDTVTVQSFAEEHGLTLQLQTVEEFKDFDQRLKDETQFCTNFVSTLEHLLEKEIQKSITAILKSYISRDLAISCTAIRRSNDKMIFKGTKFNDCLFALICQYHRGERNEPVTEKEYYQALSSCLSNAKDWHGYRLVRKQQGAAFRRNPNGDRDTAIIAAGSGNIIDELAYQAAESALAEGACSGFIGGLLPDQNLVRSMSKIRDRKLAFHEPRPCDICNRVYRDAATLRQHTLTMHSAGTHFCGCGAYFYTKYELLMHKKQAHF